MVALASIINSLWKIHVFSQALFIWGSELIVGLLVLTDIRINTVLHTPFQKSLLNNRRCNTEHIPASFSSLWRSANFWEAGSNLLQRSRKSPTIIQVMSVLQNMRKMPYAFPQIPAGTPVHCHGNPLSGGNPPPSFNNFFLISIWRRRKHPLLPFI